MHKDSSIPHPSSRYWRWGWLPVAIYLVLALSHDIGAPWTLEDNYNGAIYSQAAHNYLRAGLLATAGVPATLYFGPLPIPAQAYYVHHPCLLPLTVAAAFSVLGEKEWVARLVPIGASVLTMLFLWMLVRDCAGARTATLSAGIFASLPMELHYGEMVNFEPVALLWMVAALLFLRYLHQTGKPLWRFLMFAAFFLGLWTEWLGYLFAFIIALYFLRSVRSNQRGLQWILFGLMALSILLFLAQIRHVNPTAWQDAGSQLRFRMSGKGATGANFTWGEWISTVGYALEALIPWYYWALALTGVIVFFHRQTHLEGSRFLARAAASLFVLDALYLVGFRNASYIHDFAGFYFIAPVAMMAGVALNAFVVWMGGLVREMYLVRMANAIVCAVVSFLAYTGYADAQKFDSQFLILDGDKPEPATLVPDLGRLIGATFSPGTEVLCNFDPYSSTLPYYAERTIVNNLTTYNEWKEAVTPQHSGGVIWLGEPGAQGILAQLARETTHVVEVDGVHFCFWTPNGKQ